MMESSRRGFIVGAAVAGAALGACKEASPQEEDVAPPEDLMREHGVLNRILLIYDEGVRRLEARETLPLDALRASASTT
jgi:hypothetical protein